MMGVRFYGVNSRRDLYGILAPPVAANFKTLQFYSVLPDFPFADRWDVNYRIGSKSNDSYDIVNIGRITVSDERRIPSRRLLSLVV